MKSPNPIPRTSARDFLREIVERLGSEGPPRVIPYARVKELCPPFSRASVYRLLEGGELRGKRIGETVFVDLESVRELFEKAPDWGAE